MDKTVILHNPTIDNCVALWLQAKYQRSKSEQTRKHYATTIRSFRAYIQDKGLDLFSDERLVALSAQVWAGEGVNKELGASAFNKNVGIVSSFYNYCVRQGFEYGGRVLELNPMRRVERRPVELYHRVQLLSRETLRKALSTIETDSLVGKRDKLILLVALLTGRRLSEIANMRRENLRWESGICVITFPRTKGNKTIKDTLSRGISSQFEDYFTMMDELCPNHDPQTVWIVLSPNGYGYPLSGRSLENICYKHLGTQNFHVLRHAFAHEMENAGAKTSEIQARLQHSNLSTTGIYLARLSSDVNPYAGIIESLFQD